MDTITSNNVTISGHTWTPAASVTPVHDFDGNLTFDGRWNYSWDAENRNTRMETTVAAATAGVPRQRLDFVYDSEGRRVAKTVSTSPDGSTWTLSQDLRFLYDGWNLIAEYEMYHLVGGNYLLLQATHTWGIDLSGTPQGAGGVGGLLCSTLTHSDWSTHPYFPAFDGNGNVSAWVGENGSLLGRMEYSPFGQLIAQYKFTLANDDSLARLPFGFSTKYTDMETGLLYYGYRYYDPLTGRWPSRDPIEEIGGINLYGFVKNNLPNCVDILGMKGYLVYRRLGLDLRGFEQLPLTGHVFLAFTEEGASEHQKKEWRRGLKHLGLSSSKVHTFSFHPTSVYIHRAQSDGHVRKSAADGDRLSVVNTKGSYVDIDEKSHDIDSFNSGGDKREVASNWCDQMMLFNQSIMSARKNNGRIGFYTNPQGNRVSEDYGGTPDPATYSFLGENCGHWAWTMARRAGLSAPNRGDSIRNSAWNGGVGMGGILHPIGVALDYTVRGYFGIFDLITN